MMIDILEENCRFSPIRDSTHNDDGYYNQYLRKLKFDNFKEEIKKEFKNNDKYFSEKEIYIK